MIRKELDVKVNKETYYPDLKVVLGYRQNESRFYVYVANHAQLQDKNESQPHEERFVLQFCCKSI